MYLRQTKSKKKSAEDFNSRIFFFNFKGFFMFFRFINYGGGYYEYDKNQDYYGSLFRPNAFYRKQSIYGADTDSYDRIPFFKRFRTPYYGGY